jgi:hypothetical protein
MFNSESVLQSWAEYKINLRFLHFYYIPDGK